MGMHFKENEEKITLWMIIGAIFIIGVLIASIIIYFLNMNKSVQEEHIIGEIKNEEQDDDFEEVSIDMGKTINEAQNEINATTNALVENEDVNENKINSTSTNAKEISSSSNVEKSDEKKETNTIDANNGISKETNSSIQEKGKEEGKMENEEIKFTAPIKGNIIREFAFDSLVYSETLEEWVTHNGVDINASKSAVVKSAANGTVYAIKNDPRYGLTVIVNHENGYQTVYANLLTAEYVVEGENIEAGQTIGTVGNSATFEIADEYHLHFELLKDGNYLEPTNYIDF